jgi:uncharacterized protein YlxP (DUF503 family)
MPFARFTVHHNLKEKRQFAGRVLEKKKTNKKTHNFKEKRQLAGRVLEEKKIYIYIIIIIFRSLS